MSNSTMTATDGTIWAAIDQPPPACSIAVPGNQPSAYDRPGGRARTNEGTMKSHVQVVVIGGGVVGCSVLYHLTKAGWRDVVLVERSELTSGSTWHAAGGMHTINLDPNVAKLQQYTIKLYREIEAIPGQSCEVQNAEAQMLARTEERLDWRKQD